MFALKEMNLKFIIFNLGFVVSDVDLMVKKQPWVNSYLSVA